MNRKSRERVRVLFTARLNYMNRKSRKRVRVLFTARLTAQPNQVYGQVRGERVPLESINRNGDAAVARCRSVYEASDDLDLSPVAGAEALDLLPVAGAEALDLSPVAGAEALEGISDMERRKSIKFAGRIGGCDNSARIFHAIKRLPLRITPI